MFYCTFYTKITSHTVLDFRMPIDMSENSISPTTVTMTADTNNAESSSSLTTTTTLNNDKSPPLSFTVQSIPRPNSPIQTLSKQLDKLRRFLSTLYYFGTDISNEIGERVRILITALVVRKLLFIQRKPIHLFYRIMLCLLKNFTENYKQRLIFRYGHLLYHF